MLKKPYPFKPDATVTLVPNSGIQFLDFGFPEEFTKSVSRSYWCERKSDIQDGQGRMAEDIHPVIRDEEGQFYHRDSEKRVRYAPEDDVLTRNGDQAFDKLSGRWLPLPVFRGKDEESFWPGPTNWARLYITRLDTPDEDGNKWRVTIALDTLVCQAREGGPYTMPEPRDAADLQYFGVAHQPDILRSYLLEDWVREWLRDIYLDAENRNVTGKARRKTMEDLSHPGAYWAYYLLVLATLTGNLDGEEWGQRVDHSIVSPNIPLFRFLVEEDYGPRKKPIPVDLVLDIGNSRTCGLFIEEGDGAQRVDMSQLYRLELRDLSNPAHICTEPFESRLEFHMADFNLESYSRMSRRPKRDAFWWPSSVRVGPEAAWLASKSDGTLGASGMSSPKRYLWDTAARPSPWVNNTATLRRGEQPKSIKGPVVSRLTRDGRLARAGDPGASVGMEAAYSRSSMYMLMLIELLTHAMAQINAPGNRAYRARSEEPRQLRTVILTLPSATPVAEQRVMKRLAKQAIDLLWKVMDWEDGNPIRLKPSLKVDWDEATATHLVYLYNEITQKLQSSPRDFFRIMGRTSPDNHPALRLASMDMGGGTTDLMIIEHEVVDDDRTILPRQLFREGFRLAGDDILKQIIEALILPSIGEALATAGVADPNILLSELFGGDREGMAQQERQRRSLFVNHVLKPAALMLINHYETDYARGVDSALSFTLGDVLSQRGTPIGAPVREFLEDAARRRAAPDFHLEEVAIRSTTKRLEATVRGVVAAMLTDLCDVVRAYDCDVLLLSGRPSTMPVIQDFIISLMPVPVHRIIPMSGYDIGNWYPFHSPTFRIEDPKTTAAVGAILCQVGEGRIEGMLVRSGEIRMRSTARFIGVLERNDQILDNKLVFSDIDLDHDTSDTAHSVALTPPAFIGYRQLPLERWKTTPLYFLGFRDSRFAAEYAMPLTVTLARGSNTPEEGEEAMEDFEVEDAVDRNGETCGDKLKLTFQTLRVEREQEAGYWLDSGVLKVGRE